MEGLFKLWAKRIPRYNIEYDFLFERFAFKANTSKDEELKEAKGFIFSSYYEFYIYAFFLGIYSNNLIQIKPGKSSKDFSHAIENWGSKKSLSRKDFTSLQKYIFSMVVAKSEIDFLKLELTESAEEINETVFSLINIMESYTNGGLQIIKEKVEGSPNFFYSAPENAMNLILAANKSD